MQERYLDDQQHAYTRNGGVLGRKGEKKMKSNMIQDYNDVMSGIDWADQMVS